MSGYSLATVKGSWRDKFMWMEKTGLVVGDLCSAERQVDTGRIELVGRWPVERFGKQNGKEWISFELVRLDHFLVEK